MKSGTTKSVEINFPTINNMKKLIEFEDDDYFYRGTIIVIKDAEITPSGNYDKKYCMIGNLGGKFEMLDLYRSMGSCIIHPLEPTIPNHFATDKAGIKEWVRQYFEYFFTKEGYNEYSVKLDDIIFIEDLSDYFAQADRNLFMK